MLKFTSASDSVRAITDIILTVTIIRTGITRDLITARTIGTAGIVIIGIIIPTITGTSLIGIATPGWLETISSQPNFLIGTRLRDSAHETSALFPLLWRNRRFCHRAFARLIDLEFFSQLLNERRYFLLSFRFDLLPERLFDFPAFLNVPRFKPSAILWIKLKTGVANCRVSFSRNNLSAHILPLTHQVALFRTHLHPKLSVALEILPGIWRHSEPAFSYALPRRRAVRLT
jgi:hypothetical protein